MLDLAIVGCQVIDGTGRPGFRADVGVEDGRVVEVGDLSAAPAKKRIDASGKVVCPGFVDMHSHSDIILAAEPSAQARLMEGRVRQGITTEIVGNCGLGVAPSDSSSRRVLRSQAAFLTPEGVVPTWGTVGEYMELLEGQGVAVNVGTLVPHGALRATTRGFGPGRASEEELRRMERLLARALEEGAFGISFGLIYPPGQYAPTGELIRLVRVLKPYGRYAAFHQRGGGPETLLRSVAEIVEVGRRTGVPVEHSHEQVHGRGDWSAIWETVELKERARREGVAVGQDLIPYTSVCTTMAALYPPWALAGGLPALIGRLRDPKLRRRMEREVVGEVPRWPPWEEEGWPVNLVRDFGWENLYVAFVESEENKHLEGKSLSELGDMFGKFPFDAISDLMVAENGAVTVLIFGISGDRETDEPLKELMRLEGRAFVTDAWEVGRGRPHPGAYGAFSRVLGKYVREEGVLSLEEAIYRMTGLPAGRLGLEDRGVVRKGAWADLVVLDPEVVRNRSTHEDPRAFPEGIEVVVVGGRVVVEEGKYTGEMAGQVLRCTGKGGTWG